MKAKIWLGIGQVMGGIGELRPNGGIFELTDDDVKKLNEPASPYRIERIASGENNGSSASRKAGVPSATRKRQRSDGE